MSQISFSGLDGPSPRGRRARLNCRPVDALSTYWTCSTWNGFALGSRITPLLSKACRKKRLCHPVQFSALRSDHARLACRGASSEALSGARVSGRASSRAIRRALGYGGYEDGTSIPVEVVALTGHGNILAAFVLTQRDFRAFSQLRIPERPQSRCLVPLSPAAKEWSESRIRPERLEPRILLSKAQPFPELHRQLEDFATSIPARPSAPRDVAGNPGANLIGELQRHIQENTLTPSGYEELCRHVFVYVFDPHLYGFKRQAQTSDGANRYDFICRITPGQPFWDNLRADFHTKALLFECKNYNEKITADQVYSTERYLFTGALRTVCFRISRLGPDDGCISAAQGAMLPETNPVAVQSGPDRIDQTEIR